MKKALRYILYGLLGLIILIAAAGLFSRDDLTVPAGLKGKHIEIAGTTIRYFQKGKGPDVLLIHGLPGCIEDWDPVIDTLAKRYRVTAYDRPGHGYSGSRGARYSFESNAETAIELIRMLGLRNVVAAGHSYGGGVILAMALKKPAGVKGYVCVAALSYPVKHIDPLYRVVRIPLLGRGIALLTSLTTGRSMVDAGMKDAFAPNLDYMTQDILDLRARIFLQPKVIVTLAREGLNINRDTPGMVPAYPAITAPFVILHGSDDRLLPAQDSRQLDSVLSASRLVILKGIGHQVQFVRPDAVIGAIDALSRKK